MSARRTHISSSFGVEALESRSLLSGIPAPDPADVTLLNGQHPVANETFLDPDEDWTVAQGGHGSMPPPTFLNDDDMYAFEDEGLASADQWDDQDLNDQYAQYDDVDPSDYSGVTGLPSAATQHGGPAHQAPQGPINFEIPVGGFDATSVTTPDAATVGDTEDVVPEVAVLRPLDGSVAAPSFLDFTAAPGEFEGSAALFTFGAPAKTSFTAVEARKPGVVGTFVGE